MFHEFFIFQTQDEYGMIASKTKMEPVESDASRTNEEIINKASTLDVEVDKPEYMEVSYTRDEYAYAAKESGELRRSIGDIRVGAQYPCNQCNYMAKRSNDLKKPQRKET